MSFMRIGILTFHRSDNYGSVLQAFALCEYLRGIGQEAEIVNYEYWYDCRQYMVLRLYSYYYFPVIKTDILSLKMHLRRRKNFKSFRNNYLHISSKNIIHTRTLKSLNKKYDAFIAGSDQIWNFTILNNKINKAFFLQFAEKSKLKIAYAVSMGDNPIPVKLLKSFKSAIKDFNLISFRENSTKQYIESIFPEMNFCTACDPVFLHKKEFYIKTFKIIKCKQDTKYIFLYILGGLKRNLDWIKLSINFAIQNKYAVYYILDKKDMVSSLLKGCYDVSGTSPTNFLSLLMNANFVMSNSFHATAFSIIFNIPFVVFGRNGSNFRMKNLLSYLNMEQLFIDLTKLTSPKENPLYYAMLYNKNIDYNKVNNFIEKMCYKSQNLFSLLDSKK